MSEKVEFLPVLINETCTERIYRWDINNRDITLVSRQHPGMNECELEIFFEGDINRQYTVKYGENTLLENSYSLGKNTVVKGLKSRGKRYFFRIYENMGNEENPITPVLSFKTIIRYPYGRTFMDNFKHLTQRFGQDTVIGYDLKYYSNDDSLDDVIRDLGDTSISGYIDHILCSVIRPEMNQMQKAIEIGKFLGLAVHHNPIHINLKETVRAIDEFVEKGWEKANIDNEAVWLMELGHTRCGVMNGFVSTAFLRRIGVPNEVFYGCGGHTTGKVFIDGAWRLWDIDAFKGVIPLDPEGNLPTLDWLRQNDNVLLLDTVPSWEDSRLDEGWLKTNNGTRMTGYIGGGRYHSETGYGSSFIGGPKEFPPSLPIALPLRRKNGNEVLLEWIGSYDRDGDFRDYLVEIKDENENKTIFVGTSAEPSVTLKLPSADKNYIWSVKARDFHAKGTPYEGKIDYSCHSPIKIQNGDLNNNRYCWDFLCANDFDGRVNLVTSGDSYDFMRVEGFDDVLGQTNYCKTELWKLKAGESGKSIYRLVDESNCWFNGCHIRSLWKRTLDNVKRNKDGWHLTSVLRIDRSGMAGKSKFPVVWIGRENSYLGFGLMIDPEKGLIFTGSNIFGDWRCGKGFDPCGWFRLDIVNVAGKKTVNYYINGELLYTEDSNIFREEVFDVDAVYLSSNPEAELDFMVSDIVI